MPNKAEEQQRVKLVHYKGCDTPELDATETYCCIVSCRLKVVLENNSFIPAGGGILYSSLIKGKADKDLGLQIKKL